MDEVTFDIYDGAMKPGCVVLRIRQNGHWGSVEVTRDAALIISASMDLYRAAKMDEDYITPADEAIKAQSYALDKAEGAPLGTRWGKFLHRNDRLSTQPSAAPQGQGEAYVSQDDLHDAIEDAYEAGHRSARGLTHESMGDIMAQHCNSHPQPSGLREACEISQAQAAEWHTRLVKEEAENKILGEAMRKIHAHAFSPNDGRSPSDWYNDVQVIARAALAQTDREAQG